MSFGSRLKEIRKAHNISQKQVALEIGVSTTTISQYESDCRFPNEEILKRLCKYYRISSDYLLGLTDTKYAPFSQKEVNERIPSGQIDLLFEIINIIKKRTSEEPTL